MSNPCCNKMFGLCAAFVILGAAALFLVPGRTVADEKHDHGHAHGDTPPALTSQNYVPVQQIHLYLCAFHVAKNNPSFAVEAHHYCSATTSPQTGAVHQCLVYDSKGPNAKLLGVEYIISHETYQTLSAEEKKYWHPHAYEILSGQLIAPDMPKMGDDVFPGLIRTWGKTWHTWPDPAQNLPLGDPLLMWSANGDGQIPDEMISKRDAQFGISTAEIRERRKFMGMQVPQLPPAKSMSELGRQFTTSGADDPQPLK